MSNKIKVRKFNSFGLSEIKLLLGANKLFDKSKLTDPSWTEACLDEEIDLDFSFSKKSELGAYLYNQLNSSVKLDNEDAGMWTWLCFAYIDRLISQKNTGKWYLDKPHYVFTYKGHKSKLTYRHFIYSSYMAHSYWGDKAEVFNADTEPHQYGDPREQFLSRNYMYQYFEIFYSTFYDPSKGKIKDGGNVYTEKDKNGIWKKKKDGTYRGRGGLRRWIKVFDQKAKIYRLHAMKEKEIKKVMPSEF
tara:strand:+ start:177 stop:914 length:738 start_codon:yes stop_codon:yes gene_type:complete